MAVTSEPSPFTSVTASPIEPHESDDLPIELKVPLPTSSACSDAEEEKGEIVADSANEVFKSEEEESHSDIKIPVAEEPKDVFTENPRPEEPHDLPAVTLAELARLVELEAYQKRQALLAQTRLGNLRLSCGLDKRLISTLSIAYGDLIDQYKTDDQAGFAGLYEACEQLKSSCSNASASVVDQDKDNGETPLQQMVTDGRNSIQTLPLEDQKNMLTFLSQLRTDPDFLAERISHLSSTELTALTSSYHPAGIDFSILQNHSHGKSQFFSRDSQMMKLSRRMDNVRWFHIQDPFFALLYGAFDTSTMPGSYEYTRRMEIWSAVCARTMTEGFGGSRPGSDELAIASLDAFASIQDWSLKPKVEVYLMSVLTKGAFLLEPHASQPVNFKEPLETHNAKAAVAEADFFENALLDLCDLLTASDIQRAVPASALTFAHAVLRRIEDPKLRLRAQQFIVIRWYFATFISSIAVYPEVRGIMLTQHIGETVRRLILQKLVVKMQELVFDVILPSNHNALVHPSMRDRIMAIFHAFAPPLVSKDHDLPFVSSITDEEASARFLMLSPLDIASLVQVLCPDRTPSQDSTERASTIPLSDPPSTAGSSTLVPESSDVGSTVTLSATHPTTIDIVPSEASVPKTCVDSQDSPDLHGGDLKAETKSKEASSNDPFFELKRSCQKLKDVSSRNTSASPESFSKADSWAFVYYSKDGSKLSVESIGIEGPDTALPDFASNRQHDKIRARADERDSYASLKVAMVGLLYEGDGPNTETVEPATVTGAFGHPDPFEALETLMKAAMDKAHSDLDFASAHVWWRKLQIYQDYLARHSSKSSRTLFHDIARDLQGAVNVAADIGKHCEAQCRSLGRLQKCNKSMLARMDELRNALRVKMWYVSDVRHSATYEESLYVTRALRTMASSKRPKQPGSISSWARQRLRGTNIHDRAEAQTLEAMVAPKEHGGLSKLADEQVELTSRWLTRKSIENFCKGEERIHRFCYEVQRSIGRIAGVSLLESPVLWSSNLFRREKASFDSQRSRSNVFGSPFTSPFVPPAPFEPSRLHTPISAAPALSSKAGPAALARSPTNTFGGLWSASHPRRQPTGLGLQGNPFTLPPTPTSPPMSWSNNPFGPNSPLHGVTSTLPSYSNPSAGHSRGNSEGEVSQERKAFAEQTKKTLCSLMVSDLGYLLWNQGSETDTWVNDHSELLESEAKYTLVSGRAMSSEHGMDKAIQDTSQQDATLGDLPSTKSSFPLATPTPPNSFPFKELYTTLLRRMSLTHDPYTKLRLLYELEDLIVKSMDSPMPTDLPPRDSIRLSRHYKHPSLRSKSVPRTKANSLEEVIANCTERRAGTLKYKAPKVAPAIVPSEIGTAEPNTSSTDDIVNTLYTIFRDPTLRPQTLFRDLQYIAAFIPASTLDQTAHGKAFWDAGLAALALKEDLCDSMVRHANTITAYHISPRASLDPAADNAVAATTLQDAANLWLVTAKEGSPVAARELGLFYLTHPELLPRVTMPFSKAKDVFRAVMANDTRVGDKEKGALDPYTFAVVLHWMEIAANGGDKDAGIFLRGNGELSGGR